MVVKEQRSEKLQNGPDYITPPGHLRCKPQYCRSVHRWRVCFVFAVGYGSRASRHQYDAHIQAPRRADLSFQNYLPQASHCVRWQALRMQSPGFLQIMRPSANPLRNCRARSRSSFQYFELTYVVAMYMNEYVHMSTKYVETLGSGFLTLS